MNGSLQTVKMFGEEKDYAEIAKEIESVPGVVRCTFFPKCPLPSSHLEVEHGTARTSALLRMLINVRVLERVSV